MSVLEKKVSAVDDWNVNDNKGFFIKVRERGLLGYNDTKDTNTQSRGRKTLVVLRDHAACSALVEGAQKEKKPFHCRRQSPMSVGTLAHREDR